MNMKVYVISLQVDRNGLDIHFKKWVEGESVEAVLKSESKDWWGPYLEEGLNGDSWDEIGEVCKLGSVLIWNFDEVGLYAGVDKASVLEVAMDDVP